MTDDGERFHVSSWLTKSIVFVEKTGRRYNSLYWLHENHGFPDKYVVSR